MSRIAQKSDLSDPEVIAAFAGRVGSERKLTALYLLTVAHIRGTSPQAWNAWKSKLLKVLYRSTTRVLGDRAPGPDAEVETRKHEALGDPSSSPADRQLAKGYRYWCTRVTNPTCLPAFTPAKRVMPWTPSSGRVEKIGRSISGKP